MIVTHTQSNDPCKLLTNLTGGPEIDRVGQVASPVRFHVGGSLLKVARGTQPSPLLG